MPSELITCMKEKGKRIIAPILFYSGYYGLQLSRLRDKAPILMYHRVSNVNQGDGLHMGFEIGVTKDNFNAQMKYIKEKMNPVPLSDIVKYISIGNTIPERTVAVTFDDGYEDNYINAYPILKKYSIPATVFIACGFIESAEIFWWDKIGEIIKKTSSNIIDTAILDSFSNDPMGYRQKISLDNINNREKAWSTLTTLLKQLDNKRIREVISILQAHLRVREEDIDSVAHRLLTWSQIDEMSNNGIEFGAHTVSHSNLAKISDVIEVKKEIEVSKKYLEEKINKPVHGFAYPYGLRKDYNEAIKKMAIDAGFLYVCTAETGILHTKSDVYELYRISMPNFPLPLSLQMISKYRTPHK